MHTFVNNDDHHYCNSFTRIIATIISRFDEKQSLYQMIFVRERDRRLKTPDSMTFPASERFKALLLTCASFIKQFTHFMEVSFKALKNLLTFVGFLHSNGQPQRMFGNTRFLWQSMGSFVVHPV